MYMSRFKKKIAISNNIINIKNKQYIFNASNLIILKENNNWEEIILLKLYSEYVKNTKLIKYHFSNNHVVFFFLYRIFD